MADFSSPHDPIPGIRQAVDQIQALMAELAPIPMSYHARLKADGASESLADALTTQLNSRIVAKFVFGAE